MTATDTQLKTANLLLGVLISFGFLTLLGLVFPVFFSQEAPSFGWNISRAVTPGIFVVLFLTGGILAVFVARRLAVLALSPLLFGAVFQIVAGAPVFSSGTVIMEVPVGTILMSENKSCGVGWKRFDGLAGRMPLGAGAGIQIDGHPLTIRRIGDFPGGEEVVALKERHIPIHDHSNGTFKELLQDSDLFGNHTPGAPDSIEPWGPEPGVYSFAPLVPFGGGDETTGDLHENMPPYFIVTFCQKV